MNENTNKKQILLKFSDEEYEKLIWLADKLDLNISELIRSLIPNVNIPKSNIVMEDNITTAGINDLVPIIHPLDKEKLRGYLQKLIDKGWALTLAKEIMQQLLDKEGEHLTVGTYRRLSRWVNPYRQTEREKYVKKKAEEISRLLFGHIINRVE